MGLSRDCRNFLSTPYYLRDKWSYGIQIWQIYSQGPSEQKAFKILGENEAWAYPGTTQIFWVPPIISGTRKATKFKFCTHILSIDQNKSPLQISGKVAGCIVRTLKTFQGTHILGASRGLPCDSSAVLLWVNVMLTWAKFNNFFHSSSQGSTVYVTWMHRTTSLQIYHCEMYLVKCTTTSEKPAQWLGCYYNDKLSDILCIYLVSLFRYRPAS